MTAKRQRSRTQRVASHPVRVAAAGGDGGIVVVLILATLITLWKVCTSDFTPWDDYPNVAKNPLLNPVTLDGVLYFWAHPHMSIYIPLTYTVWGILAVIARVQSPDAAGIWLNPWIFHTANLVVHVAAVVIAYKLLKLLTGQKWPAMAGALLFGLHPVQVESVAWVAGMKDVLCGAFSLLALWQYVLFARAGDGAEPQRSERARQIHYAAATVAFVLAMLAKPSAMTIPFAAMLIDRFLLSRSWRRIVRALGPWLVLSAGCAVVARLSQLVQVPSDGGRLWLRPLLAGDALSFYLRQIIWPARLAVQYHHSPQVLMQGRWIWFAWIVPLSLAIVAWGLRRRWPWVLVSLGLLVVATAPILGLVPFEFERISLVADHYLYLAMIGPALALAFALTAVRSARIPTILTSLVLVAFAARSYAQTSHWLDTETLFRHTLAVNPMSEVAYNQLADRAFMANDFQIAERLARQAIEIQPLHPEAYVTLGAALAAQNRKAEAIPAYRRALDLQPDNAVALDDLAVALAERRQFDEAIPLAQKSIKLDPLNPQAHSDLAAMLGQTGQVAEALKESQAAVELAPKDARAQTNLAILLVMSGQRATAIDHLHDALAADPQNSLARKVLADLEK
jgi:Flp pilus assembly protein TadD